MRPRASVPAVLSTAIAAALALAATPAWAMPADVAVENDAFGPNAVSINQGDAVTWHFNESGHNVDVTDGPEKFASPKTSNGGTYQHTFNKPGTYSYICDYHPSKMKGTITVAAAPAGGGNTATTPTTSGSTQQPTTTTSPSAGANPVAPSGSLGAVDAAAPAVRSLGVKNGRLALNVSEDGRLVVRYVKAGAHGHVVHKRIVRAHKGTVRLSLRRWMKSGRYRVHVMAYDAAGNASRPVRVSAVVR